MFFKEVIGHEEIKQRLLATLQSGRVSHAQLFTGETGSGSLALAWLLPNIFLHRAISTRKLVGFARLAKRCKN